MKKPKDLTRTQKQGVREWVLSRDNVTAARIRADGRVEAYGIMPNTNTWGWYFDGWADEIYQTMRLFVERQERQTERKERGYLETRN